MAISYIATMVFTQYRIRDAINCLSTLDTIIDQIKASSSFQHGAVGK